MHAVSLVYSCDRKWLSAFLKSGNFNVWIFLPLSPTLLFSLNFPLRVMEEEIFLEEMKGNDESSVTCILIKLVSLPKKYYKTPSSLSIGERVGFRFSVDRFDWDPCMTRRLNWNCHMTWKTRIEIWKIWGLNQRHTATSVNVFLTIKGWEPETCWSCLSQEIPSYIACFQGFDSLNY